MDGIFRYGVTCVLLFIFTQNGLLNRKCLALKTQDTVVADVLIEPAQIWRIGRLEQMQLLEKLKRFIRHTFDAEVAQQRKLRAQPLGAKLAFSTRVNPFLSNTVIPPYPKMTPKLNRFQQLRSIMQNYPMLAPPTPFSFYAALPQYIKPVSHSSQQAILKPPDVKNAVLPASEIIMRRKKSKQIMSDHRSLIPINPLKGVSRNAESPSFKAINKRKRRSNSIIPNGPFSLISTKKALIGFHDTSLLKQT